MTRPPIDPACVLFWGSGLLFSVAVWVWLVFGLAHALKVFLSRMESLL